ncbi:MAG: hypothetical protein M1827_005780 [Pycnora praestabilis]|nr:MAG: hypothetical protein M1827_005780 [Pycnora praestabilis]
MMEYFNYTKAKLHQGSTEKSEAPVLDDETEEFLQRMVSEGTPPPLPDRPILHEAGDPTGNEQQLVLMHAEETPLPDTPDDSLTLEPEEKGKGKEKEGDKVDKSSGKEKKPFRWSFLRRDSRDRANKDKQAAGADLGSAAAALKAADEHVDDPHEAHKEEEDMTIILDKLNLAAVNNRVFSISKESQELLQKFTLVLKDLGNGVPTAYDDLESLLTNSENQIQRMYSHLPSFLQKLIQTLPNKMTGSLMPEMLAAAAEKQGINSAGMAGAAKKAGLKVPSLKDLVTKPGAVAGMLRTIMNFLKLRFPAFLGMNVLWSLALFILLFVFWYCHKRGKESRLEKERLLTEEEAKEVYERDVHGESSSAEGPATTAPVTAEGSTVNAASHPDPDPDPEVEDIEKYINAAAVDVPAATAEKQH